MKKALLIIAAVILLLLVGIGFYSVSITSSDVILDNVYVNGINIGNMSKSEALVALEKVNNKTGIIIELKGDDKVYKYDAARLGYGFDLNKGVEIAYGLGRDSNIINNTLTTLSQKFLNISEVIELPIELINDKFDVIFEEISQDIESELVESTFDIIEGEVVFEEGSDGKTILKEELKNLIVSSIEQKNISKDDKDKSYTFEIPIELSERKLDLESMKKITGIIGEYTTKFDASISGRTHNIKLAAKSIDGKIIQPGETLSYNQSTGRRTYENGYKDASVIVNGEYEQGVGGGVCQVSSTLYNAALYANLDIVERRNHSVPSNYTPISRDAVVSFGAIDFVVKNPYDYPIIIKSFTNGGTITVRVYGNVETAPKVELSSEIIQTNPRSVVYINDETLPLGTEKVKFQGRDQIKGRLYKTINGVTTTVATDTYPAKSKEILVGTKAPEEVPIEVPTSNDVSE